MAHEAMQYSLLAQARETVALVSGYIDTVHLRQSWPACTVPICSDLRIIGLGTSLPRRPAHHAIDISLPILPLQLLGGQG